MLVIILLIIISHTLTVNQYLILKLWVVSNSLLKSLMLTLILEPVNHNINTNVYSTNGIDPTLLQ